MTNSLDFATYSRAASSTAKYPHPFKNILYSAGKISGEIGELNEIIFKQLRISPEHQLEPGLEEGYNVVLCTAEDFMSPDAINKAELELGDILWYLNDIAINLGTTLEAVALRNLDKLKARREAGTITSINRTEG